MTALSLLLAAGLGLSLAGCSSEPACVEYDTAVSSQTFDACMKSKRWLGPTSYQCQVAAEAVSCKRRVASPLPAAQGGR